MGVILPLKYSAGRTIAIPRLVNKEKVGGWEIWAVSNKAFAAEGF